MSNNLHQYPVENREQLRQQAIKTFLLCSQVHSNRLPGLNLMKEGAQELLQFLQEDPLEKADPAVQLDMFQDR